MRNRIRQARPLVFALVFSLIAVTSAGCSDRAVSTTRTPAKSAGRTQGWGYWKDHGKKVVNPGDVRERVGFSPLTVEFDANHPRLGAVTIGGLDDPKAPRWYVEFWQGVEFHQRDMGSAQNAETMFENRPETVLGLVEPVTTDVIIRGHKGYAWNPSKPILLETTSGSKIQYFEDTCGIAWTEGSMFYSIVATGVADFNQLRKAANAAETAGQAASE